MHSSPRFVGRSRSRRCASGTKSSRTGVDGAPSSTYTGGARGLNSSGWEGSQRHASTAGLPMPGGWKVPDCQCTLCPMATCRGCGVKVRSDVKSGRCRECRGRCHCGAEKDVRAAQCRSHASAKNARTQWKSPTTRARILAGVRAAGKLRRVSFADLTEASFHARPRDGRRTGYYWEGDRRRWIYHYQWVWILAHGPIPAGFDVHHKNEDPTDDRLENLECLSEVEHGRLHMMGNRHARRSPVSANRVLELRSTGLSLEKIAQQLGCSRWTVQARLGQSTSGSTSAT